MRARRREFLRDLPGLQEAYDRNARGPAHIVAALKRYDPKLVLRYNRAIERWELWRFKGMVVPRDPRLLSPEEWVRRATYCFTLEGGPLAQEENPHFPWRRKAERAEVDWRVRRAVWLGDEWRKLNVTPDKWKAALAKKLDEQDAKDERAREKKEREDIKDITVDNIRAFKALVGSHEPIFVFGSGAGGR